jgi:hypothetical protein
MFPIGESLRPGQVVKQQGFVVRTRALLNDELRPGFKTRLVVEVAIDMETSSDQGGDSRARLFDTLTVEAQF